MPMSKFLQPGEVLLVVMHTKDRGRFIAESLPIEPHQTVDQVARVMDTYYGHEVFSIESTLRIDLSTMSAPEDVTEELAEAWVGQFPLQYGDVDGYPAWVEENSKTRELDRDYHARGDMMSSFSSFWNDAIKRNASEYDV